jgi:hypothetical protein
MQAHSFGKRFFPAKTKRDLRKCVTEPDIAVPFSGGNFLFLGSSISDKDCISTCNGNAAHILFGQFYIPSGTLTKGLKYTYL